MEHTSASQTATRIFQFLQQYTSLKFKPQRTSDKDTLFWFADLPAEEGIAHVLQAPIQPDEAPELWLNIQKPKTPLPPTPPAELLQYVTGDTNNLDKPPQLQWPEDEKGMPAELEARWKSYLAKWSSWSIQAHKVQRVHKVYFDLLKIHQQLEAQGEKYELRVGFGFLAWKTPAGIEVRRHLLTARASLDFDVERGILSVRASGDGAQTTLEQDMLDPSERPHFSVIQNIEDRLREAGEDLWSGQTLPPLLRTWVNAMDTYSLAADSVYLDDLKPVREATRRLTVTLAPALILRQRGEQSLGQAYAAVLRELDDVPNTLTSFLGMHQGGSPRTTEEDSFAEEIYFPLPANDQQLEIVKRLGRQQGVLVQGPPGTGKSHTIVNLVSHLLATDQRVLVTSHTPRALKVLREKFPAELSALCVTHLRGEEGAATILEQSVREILERAHGRNELQETRNLNQLTAQLEQARQQEWTLLDTLRDIRAGEVTSLSRFHYSGTAQSIGERLRAEEGQYGWISEFLQDESPPEKLPVTNAQALAVLAHLRGLQDPAVKAQRQDLGKVWPTQQSLMAPEAFLALCRAEQRAKKQETASQDGQNYPHYAALTRLSTQARAQVIELLEKVRVSVLNAQQHPSAWLGKAATDLMRGEASLWQELKRRTAEVLPELQERAQWLESMKVTGLEGHDPQTVAADAKAARQHLAGGGKWTGFLGLGHPAIVKERLYLRDMVKVRGQAADTPQVLSDLVRFLELDEKLSRLEAIWHSAGVQQLGPVGLRIHFWSEQERLLAELDRLTEQRREAQTLLAQLQLPEPKWWDSADLQAYAQSGQAAEAAALAKEQHELLEKLTLPLSELMSAGQAHPVVAALSQAITERDSQKYGELYRLIPALTEQKELLQTVEGWQEALATAAPILVYYLRSSPQDETWDTQLGDLEAAWAWWHTDQQLAEQANPDAEANYRLRLSDVRAQIRRTLGLLAAAKAWRNTLNRLTPYEMQGLEGWRQATKRLGKGTGKHAARYRRAARESLEQARSALPAWIMPLHLVAETFEIKAGMFDVVIVDEASQAGPEALFLSFIAKKIVIVGDDKQIEPDNVGISSEAVESLVSDYLSDLPLNARIALSDRKASLFSFGAFSYSPAISLREHFRCMPEIIKFSSDLSYADQPLIALRQYGSDRLPPLMVQQVEGGYRSGKINPPEAEAIVRQIRACTAFPEYAGKTFGVISLLGDEQAEEIARLLRAELSEAEWERRRIVCGNAYSFQGDERDVMFLSMVDSPSDSRLRLISQQHDIFQPRYNVAVSRARDQLWLFHSASLHDLKSDDLRAALIRHMQGAPTGGLSGPDEAHDLWLREEARQPLRGQRTPPAPFDSWFEVDVYLRLVERGYQVLPQYEMAGYSIDMVVVGARGRLAVECDGDHWHGPEQYSKDMHRQQILERSGMQFWRVRGSTFARDPEMALEDLWASLEARGVYPKGDPRNTPEVRLPLPNEPERSEGSLVQPADAEEGTEEDFTPPTAAPGGSGKIISPYLHWAERPLPDPRQVTQKGKVLRGLTDIIEVEGPMLCQFAYQQYAKAAGLNYSKAVQSELNKVVAAALREGVLESANDWDKPGQLELTVRLAGAPPVSVRELGPRDFTQVPPSEVAALMETLLQERPDLQRDKEQLFRHCLSLYGSQRLTMKRRDLLERGYELLGLTS